jgi:hypothetical protein
MAAAAYESALEFFGATLQAVDRELVAGHPPFGR